MKMRSGSMRLSVLAGMTAGALSSAANAQAITPPDVHALPGAGVWFFPTAYEQQLTGTANITRFRLVADGGQCNVIAGGNAFHNDMLLELTAPNGTTLLVGGDFGTPYPGSIRWTDAALDPLGFLPPSDPDPAQIDVVLSYNFGPIEGIWRVNFRNHWSSGDIPWTNIQITPCTPATCPEPGACCLPTGVCQITLPDTCSTLGGTFEGPGTVCGNCPTPPGIFVEPGNAGDVPATAAIASNAIGTNEPLLAIIGNKDIPDDVDMYMIEICDPANFSASTVGAATWDTMLWLFDENGHGITMNDDTGGLQSMIGSQFVPGYGIYFVAVSAYSRHPVADPFGRIWEPGGTERPPDGPGAGSPITHWESSTSVPSNPAYRIEFTGTCFIGGSGTCYANCDTSTNEPVLTVDDFTCFINEFAAAQGLPYEQQATHYANCDQSTSIPVLTVDDFTCFINEFAQGCP